MLCTPERGLYIKPAGKAKQVLIQPSLVKIISKK